MITTTTTPMKERLTMATTTPLMTTMTTTAPMASHHQPANNDQTGLLPLKKRKNVARVMTTTTTTTQKTSTAHSGSGIVESAPSGAGKNENTNVGIHNESSNGARKKIRAGCVVATTAAAAAAGAATLNRHSKERIADLSNQRTYLQNILRGAKNDASARATVELNDSQIAVNATNEERQALSHGM